MYVYSVCFFVSAPKCRDVVLRRSAGVVRTGYVRGMSLVAHAHNPQLKLTRPIKST